jgi:hypothetical protein
MLLFCLNKRETEKAHNDCIKKKLISLRLLSFSIFFSLRVLAFLFLNSFKIQNLTGWLSSSWFKSINSFFLFKGELGFTFLFSIFIYYIRDVNYIVGKSINEHYWWSCKGQVDTNESDQSVHFITRWISMSCWNCSPQYLGTVIFLYFWILDQLSMFGKYSIDCCVNRIWCETISRS